MKEPYNNYVKVKTEVICTSMNQAEINLVNKLSSLFGIPVSKVVESYPDFEKELQDIASAHLISICNTLIGMMDDGKFSPNDVLTYIKGLSGRYQVEVISSGKQQAPVATKKRQYAVIDAAMVAQIKKELALGKNRNAIAKQFNISYQSVYGIATGRTWTHIQSVKEQVAK